VIALVGAMALFILPAGRGRGERLLDWHTAQYLPWDILLLFGGGLSLAAAISASGADAPLTAMLSGFGAVPVVTIILLLAVVIVFSGELTSNTAAATAIMPVLAALCAARGLDLLPVFMVATLASSCGFMLPVATPPNAIAFGTGMVPMRRMMRAGLGVNLIGIAVIVGYVWLVAF
jgi:sodium-dependent dicarboxylate transporter 2/3/5